MPSDAFGYRAVAINYGSLIALLVASPILWTEVAPASVIPIVLLLGVFIYKLTIVLHDAGHGKLFATRRVNQFVGTITGWMLGSDFTSYARTHWQHHINYGLPNDPQGRDYLNLQDRSRLYLVWHLMRPLLGYNLFKLGAFSPEATAVKTTTSRRIGYFVGLGATQTIIVLISTGGGQVPWLFFLYPISAATVALFLSQIRGFCEHVPLTSVIDQRHVRTHIPNMTDRFLFYGLNFNYHVEHHLYPAIPSVHLPAIHKLLRDTAHTDATLSPSIFTTIRRRLTQCR